MANNNQRTIPGGVTKDANSIANIEYNDAAGSRKVSEVGRHLLPFPYIDTGALAYTTNLTTIRPLPKVGMGLAVYNLDTTVHAITLGESSAQTALAAGVTDNNAPKGHVGIPCTPGAWTYIATGTQNFVIADSAQLTVFIIDDNSIIQNQALY